MYLQRMCDNASAPSWALLPAELLEKIFESIPRLLLRNIGKVCRRWQNVLHRLAVKHLTSCIQNQLIEEKQLEKWGWCSATALDHNILVCSCIHLAFNFFTRKENTFLAGGFSALPIRMSGRIPVGIMSDKLFFATANEENMVYIKVINRLELESQPRMLKTLAAKNLYVHMVCCENLLVVLVNTNQVSLWNGKNETWLADLDISSIIPDDYLYACEVTVSKDLLTVHGYGNDLKERVVFFRLNTGEPAATLPQLIGTVKIKYGDGDWDEHLDLDPYSEYGSGFCNPMNTDPIQIRIRNTLWHCSRQNASACGLIRFLIKTLRIQNTDW